MFIVAEVAFAVCEIVADPATTFPPVGSVFGLFCAIAKCVCEPIKKTTKISFWSFLEIEIDEMKFATENE
ncbi:hypothetical protein PHIN6_13320 [Polynucleobacter sp. HIN6]|uniref:hypothetical protein n=1 Tax=Polynucleobacter sp. HIN6 TaxID=3047865 RepID=UPI002573367D|nr:hypothetical protein [Polynucleobacter sp. HIN6]BEI35814.1 hypothetical protein PHIN6_13320 [Polynucleobacter sp. HIN6]